jgi:hypothetical protein
MGNLRVKAAEVIDYGAVCSLGAGVNREGNVLTGRGGARGAGGRRQRVAEHPDRNRARRRAGLPPPPPPPPPPAPPTRKRGVRARAARRE